MVPAWRPGLVGGLRNWQLAAGLALVLGLALVGVIGSLVVGESGLRLGSAPFRQAPSWARPLGTDASGRDVGVFLLHAIAPTLKIGLIAGGIGTSVGVLFGLLTGFMRGP